MADGAPLSDEEVLGASAPRPLSDAEVFGSPAAARAPLSDAEVFGEPPPQPPREKPAFAPAAGRPPMAGAPKGMEPTSVDTGEGETGPGYLGRIGEAASEPFKEAWNAPAPENTTEAPSWLFGLLSKAQRAIDLGMAAPTAAIGATAAAMGIDPKAALQAVNDYAPGLMGAEGGPHLRDEASAAEAAPRGRVEPPPLRTAPEAPLPPKIRPNEPQIVATQPANAATAASDTLTRIATGSRAAGPSALDTLKQAATAPEAGRAPAANLAHSEAVPGEPAPDDFAPMSPAPIERAAPGMWPEEPATAELATTARQAEPARSAPQIATHGDDAASPAPETAPSSSQAASTAEPKPLRRPADLLDFLSAQGGVRDHRGELASLDADKWHRAAPFRRRLVRTDGMPLDSAREAAEEAGYLPPGSTIPDLLDAIDGNLRGRPVFAERDRAQAVAWDESRHDLEGQYRDELERRAAALGIEPSPSMPLDALQAEVHEREAIQGEKGASDATADRAEREIDRIAANDNIAVPWFDDSSAASSPEARAQPGAARPPEEAAHGYAPQGRAAPRGPEPVAQPASGDQAARQGAGRGAEPQAPLTERTPEGEQLVIPGAERSARQAAEAREAEGRGRLRSAAPQQPADAGLFAPPSGQDPELFMRRGPGGDASLRAALESGDVKRGARAVIERLRMQANLDEAANRRAARQGTAGRLALDPADAREIEDFIDFIGHHMFRDVGLRILRGSEDGPLGAYNAYHHVVSIFRNAIARGELPRTAIHELWHSLERVLPAADREAVAHEFQRSQARWLGGKRWAMPFLRDGELRDVLGGDEARAWIDRYGKTAARERVAIGGTDGSPTVSMRWTPQNYRFKNRSEYFAETMADRYFDHRSIEDAKARSVFAHVRDIWRKVVNGVRRLFGRDATGRIFEGFGRGEFAPPGKGGLRGPLGADDLLSGDGIAEQRARPAQQRALPLDTPEQRRQTGSLARSFLGNIFSPSTVSPAAERQAALTREEYGQARRLTQQARAGLERFRDQAPSLATPEGREFMAYLEGRSTGATLADPTLQPLADYIRSLNKNREQAIRRLPGQAQRAFIEDYFAHMWQDPARARQATESTLRGGSWQGSGRNLRQRTVPTYADGISMGLEPLHPNVVDGEMAYLSNIDRFIGTNRILQRMKANGTAKVLPMGSQPDGWVPLNGNLVEKAMPVGESAAPMKTYAPEDVARVYNNMVAPGIYGTDLAPIYDKLLRAKNFMTAAELSFSLFHASTMATEAMFSEIGRSVGLLKAGRPFDAAKAFAAFPVAPIRSYRAGAKMAAEYVQPGSQGAEIAQAMNLLTRANLSPLGRGEAQYFAGSRGPYGGGVTRGGLRLKLRAVGGDFRDAMAEAGREVASASGTSPKMGAYFRELGKNTARVFDTVSAPLFDHAIPRLKAGAALARMRDWLAEHPDAGTEEQLKAARDISDSTDNRFGELVYDNVFWHQAVKQVAFLAIRAVGWDLGTHREIEGGIADIARGRWSPRVEYLVGLAVGSTLLNGVMTYLKTGRAPSGMDFLAYDTGDKDAHGHEIRGMLPGYAREYVGLIMNALARGPMKAAGSYAYGKLASLWTGAWELFTNRDWRDDPIGPPQAGFSTARARALLPEFIARYAVDALGHLLPINWRSELGAESGRSASAGRLSPSEQVIAARPAPFSVQNPQGAARFFAHREAHPLSPQQRWREKLARERRDARPRQAQ